MHTVNIAHIWVLIAVLGLSIITLPNFQMQLFPLIQEGFAQGFPIAFDEFRMVFLKA